MFTGIIEEVGTLEALRLSGTSGKLTVRCRKVLGGPPTDDDPLRTPTMIGDSIATSGVCLTVTELTDHSFTADVMPETIRRTALAELRPGSPLNLERAMPAYGRFGGHFVSGHIDGVGKIVRLRRDENAVWYRIAASDDLVRYIVEKGSIAIDGISLTVAEVSHQAGGSWFGVSIIPHTLEETALSSKRAGNVVNLETDIVGKYVEQLCRPGAGSAGANGRAAGTDGGDGEEGSGDSAAADADARLRALLSAF